MYLIVTKSFPPEIGGIQNLMWGLSNSLSKHYKIKVFAEYHVDSKKHDQNIVFEIERISGFKFLRKYRKANLINDFIKNNKNIKGIISDHWKSLELIKTNIKKICLIHSKEINHKKGTILNERVLKVLNNVDHIISNSKYTKNLAINNGVNLNKIKIINPGFEPIKKLNPDDVKKVESLLKNKQQILITVSRFDKRKNHEKIIMALRNLKEAYPNIIYICVGHGNEEQNIKKLVKELNLNEQVLFFKNISQDFKNALISKSNIFVMPSIIYKKSVEGFGIAFIEAAQFGIPSIGGSDGGASDAIDHEKSGLICNGNSLDEIYSSIDKMLKNNNYLKYGKIAKEKSVKFHWDNIIESYKKIL